MKSAIGQVENFLTGLTAEINITDGSALLFQAPATEYSRTAQSSSSGHASLALQATEQLIRYPSTLKHACDQINLAARPRTRGFVGQRKSLSCGCDCSSVRKRRAYQQNVFGNTQGLSVTHNPHHLYQKPHWRSWSWSLSAPLLPVLQFAI